MADGRTLNKRFVALVAVVVLSAVGWGMIRITGSDEKEAYQQRIASASLEGKQSALNSSTGVATGLPIPRYVSLSSRRANVRKGPGKQYPIQWVFIRRNMPVQVVDEYKEWRRIRDFEGVEGWVHKRMLSGRRSLITVKPSVIMHEEPDFAATAVASVRPTTISEMNECRNGWCRVEVQGYEGWLHHDGVWGVALHEVF